VPFGDALGNESAPGIGKGRIFRVFEQLEQMEAGGPTNLREAFKAFAARGRRQGVVAVISDFLDPGGFEAGLKILRTIGHDVFAIHVALQTDRDPRAFGDVRFIDAETGERRDIEVTPRLAAAYREAWLTHAEELESFCGRYNIGYVRADAERPFEQVILQTFRKGRFLA
jgi:uncharacterized protein (DUF58 family)